MSQEKRRKASRTARREPFLTLPAAALLSAAARCDGLTLKVLLLLHANWTPTAHRNRSPGAILPFNTAVSITKAGRSQVAKAFQNLQDLGLAGIIQEGTRPGGPGGLLGMATVWRLPFRVPGETPPPELLKLPPGVKYPEGKVRWNSGRLHKDAEQLSNHAFQLLVAAVAHGKRTRKGALMQPEPFLIGPSQAHLWCGMKPRTASEVIRNLVQSGRLIEVTPAAGRRPTLVQLPGFYATAEKVGPRE
jgi:hypothetical protein